MTTTIDSTGRLHRRVGAGGGQWAEHQRTAPRAGLGAAPVDVALLRDDLITGAATSADVRSIASSVELDTAPADLIAVIAAHHDDPAILSRIHERCGDQWPVAVALAYNPCSPSAVLDVLGSPAYPIPSISAIAVEQPNISADVLRDAIFRGRDRLHVRAAGAHLTRRGVQLDTLVGDDVVRAPVPFARVSAEDVRSAVAAFQQHGTIIPDGVARSIAWQLQDKVAVGTELRAQLPRRSTRGC